MNWGKGKGGGLAQISEISSSTQKVGKGDGLAQIATTQRGSGGITTGSASRSGGRLSGGGLAQIASGEDSEGDYDDPDWCFDDCMEVGLHNEDACEEMCYRQGGLQWDGLAQTGTSDFWGC